MCSPMPDIPDEIWADINRLMAEEEGGRQTERLTTEELAMLVNVLVNAYEMNGMRNMAAVLRQVSGRLLNQVRELTILSKSVAHLTSRLLDERTDAEKEVGE